MDFEVTLAAVPWYSAGLAILLILDAVAWGYALYVLPISRRNTILKLVTWCWAVIPAVVLFVAAWRTTMTNHVMTHAWWFEGATYSDQVEQSLLAGPHWIVPRWVIHSSQLYFETGFVLLALFALVGMPKDRIPKVLRVAMGLVPAMLMLYLALFVGVGSD